MKTLYYLKSMAQAIMLVLLLIPGVPVLSASDTSGIYEFREIDGNLNHPDRPETGSAQSILIRVAPAAYGDGVDLPRGVPVENDGDGNIEADEQTLPSARLISNTVHDQGDAFIPSERHLNQLVFQFGQFLSHDTGLTEPNGNTTTGGATGRSGNERFAIPVEEDPTFTFSEVPLTRSIAESEATSPTGIREQINTVTAFIDGSQVYGSDSDRASALRSYYGGLLDASDGPDGELLPYNTGGLANGNAFRIPESEMFLAGDVRVNEQIGLITMHTLWLREHNRVAREIAETEFDGEDLSDSAIDEEIFQRSRAVVAALLQKVTYYEWLPALLGPGCLAPYEGYDVDADPQSANEFTAAAFRIGHTMLPPFYLPREEDGSESELSLLDAFFNPDFVSGNGMDSMIRGQVTNAQQEIDRFIVGEVRNFLFGPTIGGLDLPALNLQRGRDHGVPDFNTVRDAYGLTPAGDFLEMTGDADAAEALGYAYGEDGLEAVDLWTGGLCEPHAPGTNLGETFTTIFVNQFTRLRDGDRFYFENSDVYPYEFTEEILHTSFADVIRRNTSIEGDDVNDYAFFVPYYHPYQPDLRIGTHPDMTHHQGDDNYNGSGEGQDVSVVQSRKRWAKIHLSLENDGAFVNHMRLETSAPSGRKFSCKFFETSYGERSNVSSEMKLGYYKPVLDPGEVRDIEGNVKPTRANRKRRPNANLSICAEHCYDSTGHDVATARLSFR